MARPESREFQLRPLLDARAKIQRLNLILLKALQNPSNKKFLARYRDADVFFFTTMEDLISSNFSLWRGAFLIYLSNSREARAEAMRKMLHGLLEDNSFVFAHEVTSQSWLGPYYLDHSKARLTNRIKEIKSRAFSEKPFDLEGIWHDHTPKSKDNVEISFSSEETSRSDFVDPAHFQFLFNELSRQFNRQLQILDFVRWYSQERTEGEFHWPDHDEILGIKLIQVTTRRAERP